MVKKKAVKKKSPVKKAAAKKAPAKKKVAAKKAPAKKKVVAKKAAPKKKAVAKKAAPKKKAVAKKTVAKKAAISKPAVKVPAPKAALPTVKKAAILPVKKAPVKKASMPTDKPVPPKLKENTFLKEKIAKVLHEDPRTLDADAEQAPEVEHEPLKPIIRETPKVGRNEPCPCGSGLKYKKCHGNE
ncbi:MAG: SEC-C metal-binding domain-containing protein [Bacteriovorax sp.]|jgi:hypothetical protein